MKMETKMEMETETEEEGLYPSLPLSLSLSLFALRHGVFWGNDASSRQSSNDRA